MIEIVAQNVGAGAGKDENGNRVLMFMMPNNEARIVIPFDADGWASFQRMVAEPDKPQVQVAPAAALGGLPPLQPGNGNTPHNPFGGIMKPPGR